MRGEWSVGDLTAKRLAYVGRTWTLLTVAVFSKQCVFQQRERCLKSSAIYALPEPPWPREATRLPSSKERNTESVLVFVLSSARRAAAVAVVGDAGLGQWRGELLVGLWNVIGKMLCLLSSKTHSPAFRTFERL